METIKAEYNQQLSIARAALSAALALRDQIIELDPDFAGPSTGKLAKARSLAYKARTFSGVPLDLPSAQNEYRTSGRVGGRRTRDRIASVNS